MMAIAPPASTKRKRELSYTDTAYAAKARARLEGSRSGLMRSVAVSIQTTTRMTTAGRALVDGESSSLCDVPQPEESGGHDCEANSIGREHEHRVVGADRRRGN